jgi:hypothetical protein
VTEIADVDWNQAHATVIQQEALLAVHHAGFIFLSRTKNQRW